MAEFPDFGIPIHPSSTAVKTKRIGVTPLLPCKQCGALNNANKISWSRQGDGLIETIDSNGVNDSESGYGCWFCGSLNWRDSKPSKFPDDRNLAEPRRYRDRR